MPIIYYRDFKKELQKIFNTRYYKDSNISESIRKRIFNNKKMNKLYFAFFQHDYETSIKALYKTFHYKLSLYTLFVISNIPLFEFMYLLHTHFQHRNLVYSFIFQLCRGLQDFSIYIKFRNRCEEFVNESKDNNLAKLLINKINTAIYIFNEPYFKVNDMFLLSKLSKLNYISEYLDVCRESKKMMEGAGIFKNSVCLNHHSLTNGIVKSFFF